MKLTLLGTGTPLPDLTRRGPSQVLEVGDGLLIIDCGRGVVDRLLETGYVQPGGRALRVPLNTIALTHLHSDHITGLPDLLWAGWVAQWWEQPPALVGPPGTAAMIQHLMEAFAYDIAVRVESEPLLARGLVPEVVELEDGWVSEGNGWQLAAFRVDHAPVNEAFGFRVDSDTSSIVVSGDTRYSENLISHAQGADVLVHEVYSRSGMDRRGEAARGDARQYKRWLTISKYHTPPDEVGKVAAQAEVEHLVLSHIIAGLGGVEDIAADAERDFKKHLTVGVDLQQFEI